MASCSDGTTLIAWCWWGSNFVPAVGAIAMTLLRSRAAINWRKVAWAPSRIWSAVASLMINPASRLSATGNRLSAKLSTANLRALEISSSARRREFSASALARSYWSAKSPDFACRAANSACTSASKSGSPAFWDANMPSVLWKLASEGSGWGVDGWSDMQMVEV